MCHCLTLVLSVSKLNKLILHFKYGLQNYCQVIAFDYNPYSKDTTVYSNKNQGILIKKIYLSKWKN